MNRIIALLTMAASIGLTPGTAVAQTAKDLVGTWMLVANVNVSQNGTRTDAFGPNPKGILIFDSNGHYASVTARSDLRKFASGNRNTGTPEENKGVVMGSFSHYGTYSVADKTITLKVEASSWPSWTGADQKRTILSFTPDEFKWTVPAASIGGSGEVSWRRVK